MKRAIIYARVSSRRQADDGLPVASQIDHCQAKAGALGAIVEKIFTDGGITGRTDSRPAFQDALNYCALSKVDYLICWNSARFARNTVDAGHYKKQLARYGTRLIYSSNEVDITTDDGWFIDAINSVVDERYSRQVSSDTRRSLLKAAKDGFYIGGRVPFGYTTVPDGKRKRLAVHPSEGPTVQSIFAMALQGCGAKLIALQLNAQGLTLRGRPWAKNTIHYLLKNEVYAGWTVFNRTCKARGRALNPEADWIKVQSHAALVSSEEFERTKAMMSDRQPANVGGQPRSHFVFTGMLTCGFCGSSLQMCSGKGRSGQVYHYYGCRSNLQGKKTCPQPRMRADHFDAWLLAELLDQVLTPDRMADIIELAKGQRAQEAVRRSGKRAALVAELRATERARSNIFSILELHGKDAPNLADVTGRLRELGDRMRTLELQLVQLEDGVEEMPGPAINPREAAEVLRGIVMDCTDPKKLRQFVGAFVKGVTVGQDDVAVDYLPECLVALNRPRTVHSAQKWLLDLGSNQGPTD